jgi:NAD+ synthase
VNAKLTPDVLKIDLAVEVARVGEQLRVACRDLRKRGLVVAISSGIDSSVCAALAVAALGADKVFGLILPERDSSPASAANAKLLATHLGIRYLMLDIAPTLEAIGAYHWRDEAIRRALPEYAPGWKSKIVISGGLEGRINHFRLVAEAPTGAQREVRLELSEYLQIVAATNFKQRIRKTLEYFHADRLNYAVVGTPNRLEYDQGFFVKNGDGAADIKPIAHLYKTQVYALARHLGLPEVICSARPTTDTYSMPQGQDEFYFGIPYEQMDLALWAYNHHVPVAELALSLRITERTAQDIYRDIESKRRSTRYLHLPPVLIDEIEGVGEDWN